MINRYRRSSGVLSRCVSIVLLAFGLVGAEDPIDRQAEQTKQPQESQGQAPEIATSAAPAITASDSESGRAESEQQTDAFGRLFEYLGADGPAQYLMALAAFGALGVSIWAVWILKDTLRATMLAVRASRHGTQQTIKVVQENAQRELRAYLAVKPIFVNGIAAGQRPVIIYEVKNTGSTPAYKMKHAAKLIFGKYPLYTLNILSDEGEDAPVTVFPGETHQGQTQPQQTISAEQVSQVLTGNEYRLFLVGHATYVDAFKNTQTTEFCCVLGGQRLKYSILNPKQDGWSDAFFEFAPFHNEST
jgi:hypothetical protein